MAKVAVFIHGMWGTPDVWRNWRPAFERRGWLTQAPALRHHDPSWTDASPATPSIGLLSLLDYAADLESHIATLPMPAGEKPVLVGHSMGGLLALMLAARGAARAAVLLTPAPPAGVFALRLSNLRAFLRIETRWGWWRKPHRATQAEALWHTFNTTDPAEGAREYQGFVPDSGRALLEIGLPFLDPRRAATVDPRRVTVPLLFVGCALDRLTPPDVVRRTAQRFGHVAEFREYEGQGHWVPGQPGWQQVAGDALDWLDGIEARRGA